MKLRASKKELKDQVIGIRLPVSIVASVDSEAAQEGLSRSDIVRRLIFQRYQMKTASN